MFIFGFGLHVFPDIYKPIIIIFMTRILFVSTVNFMSAVLTIINFFF